MKTLDALDSPCDEVKYSSVPIGHDVYCGYANRFHFHECIAKDCSCSGGKDVYLTYEDAQKAVAMRPGRARNKKIYKCHICGHFHLTTKDGAGRRPKAYSRQRNRLELLWALERVTDRDLKIAKENCPKSYGLKRFSNAVDSGWKRIIVA